MQSEAAAAGRGLKAKLLRNTVCNALGMVWTLLIGFILTRYIINSIGFAAFGVWVVLEATVGHLGLADLGIRTSFVKFISNLYPQKKLDEINEVLSSGTLYYTLFGAAVLALGLLAEKALMGFLQIPPSMRGEAHFVYLLCLIIFAVENAFRAYGAVLVGLQRMDVSNRIRIYLTFPYAGMLYLFIRFGGGLRGVVAAFALRFAMETIANIAAAHRLLPSLSIRWRHVKRGRFREMLLFGIKLQLVRWEDLVVFYTDKLLISHFLTLTLVSLYELGLKVATRVYDISILLDSALVPAVSEADALGQDEVIRKIYERGSRYLMAFSAPLLAFTAAAAPLIMRIWMGEPCTEAVQVIRVFVLTFFISNIAKISRSVCIGINCMGFYLWGSAVQVALNVALSIWLIRAIGFIGVVWATFFALTASTIIFTVCYHIRFSIRIWPVMRHMLATYVAGAAAPTLLLMWFNSRPWAMGTGGVLDLLFRLAAEGVFFSAFYAGYLLGVGGFDSYDRKEFRHLLGRLTAGA